MWAEAMRASTLGWELALPIFGGVLLGYGLDRRFGTRYIFTVSLLFLGAGAGFYSLWRYGQRLAARDRKRRAAAEERKSEDV
jgi:F0F1-type ATP synthase assembly protein I